LTRALLGQVQIQEKWPRTYSFITDASSIWKPACARSSTI